MLFSLPDLPYAYDALHPFISAETLEYHHDKHHHAYVDNANRLSSDAGISNQTIEDIIKESFCTNGGLFNNVAQHYNHIHFWNWMKPGGGGRYMSGALEKAIESDLGGYQKFKTNFIETGMSQFGSGWCWISLKNEKLEISKTENGENPLVHGAIPILGCDLWEHSYYIDYRNARLKYLDIFVDKLINWEYVNTLFESAQRNSQSSL
ncbi:superoxide dismutase [Candidatus Endowatersipora endosymbiont of Watersipora subatra]|uniref:superoxide dismutase n=1 Tax=Candidatus Endowatersipora endosymbiont of Watersipora subatra TaxID=3077946 RepID=UPI00312C98D9